MGCGARCRHEQKDVGKASILLRQGLRTQQHLLIFLYIKHAKQTLPARQLYGGERNGV